MKKFLFITMLLGALYSTECEDYNSSWGTNYNCDCNESTWEAYLGDMEGCWLQGADLSYAYLSEANLSEANLQGADLSYAYLQGAWLPGANLYGADLSGANLQGADLSGAILQGANLWYAYLSGADLSGANLYGAILNGTNIEGACLEGAMGFVQTNYSGTPILEGCASGGGDCSFEDTDADGYDDVSFDEGYISGTSAGDVNLDGNLNITDIILYIEAILAD